MGASNKRSADATSTTTGCMGLRKRANPAGQPQEVPVGRVPVYIMLNLDWMTDCGSKLRDAVKIGKQLEQLKLAGVRGVMADVWWGLCEPTPGQYNFGGVVALCELLKEKGLRFQATMSFHACGGNVGDPVQIPLPVWVLEAAREKDLCYRNGVSHISEDCLSLSADRLRSLPGQRNNRTPLECYKEFMVAFLDAVRDHLGATIDEIQVGTGPCGELRYPSYMMSKGWSFPGVGLVMADDGPMRSMLKQEKGLAAPPQGMPTDQNALPDDIAIFRCSPNGKPEETDLWSKGFAKIFFEWYSKSLVSHGEAVLEMAADALRLVCADVDPNKLAFSIKISGLHWHVMHPSRATEMCAGYDNCTSSNSDSYDVIAKMLSRVSRNIGRPVIFNFTCMEMTNIDNNGNPQTFSAPEDLIAQVRCACIRHNVPLSGENALEFDLEKGSLAFERMNKQMRGWSPGRDKMHALTMLRLNDSWNRLGLAQLAKFISST